MTAPHTEVPILIVGAGPSGMTSSILLSRAGIPSLLVEKHWSTAHLPRAHIINQRTMEIFRHMGIADQVLAAATPQQLMTNNVWHTSLAGPEIARLRAWGTSPERSSEYQRASPCPMANCPQTVLEPILLHAAEEHPKAKLYFGHEFVDATQDIQGVTANVFDHATRQSYQVRAQYLIGADGGRSRVLEQAGLHVEGQAGLATAVNVWMEVDLTRFLAHRPGVLYWNARPGTDYMTGAGTLICHRPWSEFVMTVIYDPATEIVPHTEEFATARLRQIVGDDTITPRVKAFSEWTINHQVAPHYTNGRILCMGDAVHRHPPTNGLGLNTSVADAFNLVWKLAAVLRAEASPALLDTYDTERQPVGRKVVDRAIASVDDMAAIPAALGFFPGQSECEGWAALAALYEPGLEGEMRRGTLREAVKLTNYQFNAHGVELGYRYREGAIVPDGTPEPPPSRDSQLHYEPTTWPGAHLPHAWLEVDGLQISTLDLVADTGFTLFTGIGGEPWLEASRHAELTCATTVTVRCIGTRDGILDAYGDWAALREVDESGLVLVRPDRHVAWRKQHLPDDIAAATAELTSVLDVLLGKARTKPSEAPPANGPSTGATLATLNPRRGCGLSSQHGDNSTKENAPP